MKTLLVVVTALCLAGCARGRNPTSSVEPPSSHRAGYADGCTSGEVAAGYPYARFTKDVQRYQDDALYRQGWDDGQATCKGQYEAIGRAMRR